MITRFQSVRVTPPKMEEEGRTTERALLWISRAAGSLFYEYQHSTVRQRKFQDFSGADITTRKVGSAGKVSEVDPQGKASWIAF